MSFSFGTPSSTGGFGAQPAPNFSFGGSTTPAPSFGATAPQAGFNFGTPAASTTPNVAAPTAGLSFGTPSTTATSTGLGLGGGGLTFGAPAATSAPANLGTPGLSFGAQPVAATSKPSFGFGTPASTAASGFNFGTTATTPSTGLSLGTPATSGFSLGGTTPSAATTTPSLGLSFGATTSAPATLNFGTTTTASTGLNFNLGNPATSTGLNFGFGSTQPSSGVATTTQAAPVGLGGVASTTPSTTTETTKPEQAPKEQQLPNEIQQTVENFKSFVKQQKGFSSDVARCSIKEFKRVENDIDSVNNLLNEVEKELQMNKNMAEKLKYDTACVLQQVEMAQRTLDTPVGLQYENTAPLQFFMELADNFERDIQNLKLQIENTDKYLKHNGKATPLTSQDLAMGMRRIHETFIALAGRLQSVHSQVEYQKEQYLSFRKNMLHDTTNVFETSSKDYKETLSIDAALNMVTLQPPKIPSGPSPFNSINPSVVQAAAQNNPPAYPATNTFGGQGSTFNWSGTSNPPTTSRILFGTQSAFGASTPPASGFQLQKPPTGNKRAK